MTDFSQGCAFIEGEYVAIADARIPVLDWGFLHSDATYDVAHVWRGRFFRLEDHLQRFHASMASLRMSVAFNPDEIRAIMIELVRQSGLREAYVEIICTRGLPEPGSRDPRSCRNRFLAFAIPFVWIASQQQRQQGLNLLISRQQRIPPESVDPVIKNYHWLDMVQALFEAYDNGADSAVVVDAGGNLVEGPGFNIFTRHGNLLRTPEHGVLEGITRKTVLELLALEKYEFSLSLLPASLARSADEVFITSTAGGVIPVTAINSEPIGDGRPGPLTTSLNKAYWSLHDQSAYCTDIVYDKESK